MKITSKQYAESLHEVVWDKNNEQIKIIINNFFNILIQNNDAAKAEAIVGDFKKIWNAKQGIVEAEVISARELDKASFKLLNDYIAGLSRSEKVNLNKKINKNILGGAIIKYEDKILDGSLRAELRELKTEMLK